MKTAQSQNVVRPIRYKEQKERDIDTSHANESSDHQYVDFHRSRMFRMSKSGNGKRNNQWQNLMKQHDIQDYHKNIDKDVTESLLPQDDQKKDPLTLFEIDNIRKRIQEKKFIHATEGHSPKTNPTPFELRKEEQIHSSEVNLNKSQDEELINQMIQVQKLNSKPPQILVRRNKTAQKNARYQSQGSLNKDKNKPDEPCKRLLKLSSITNHLYRLEDQRKKE